MNRVMIIGLLVLIIIIIGVLILSTPEGTPENGEETTMEGEDEMMTEKGLVIELASQNDSGEMGTATLTEMNGQTKVVISLTGVPAGVEQPMHIHAGSCSELGGVNYPLTNVVNGSSETVVDVSLNQLTNELPLAVNVHKSTSEASVYVACGDITQ